ncbi:hypothetical protein ACGFH8_11820 [Micromonospora sp. NPDC049175]|uniref:hypothetical protein n=1 Tax=Micromonospora sp. NPDC049175 TaxID=3364266 RepID=UPI00371D7811
MIRTKGNYRAAYKDTSGPRPFWTHRKVEAWDDSGMALVVNEKQGRLARADEWTNFAGVTVDDDSVVAAVPGGGWLVEWTADDGTTHTEPLLAWAVNSSGWATPIDGSTDGLAMPLEDDTRGWRLIPPTAPGVAQ